MGKRAGPDIRHAGLVVFASHVLSAFTGLLFTLMVTRTLPEADFGVWQNIGDLVFYFTVLENVMPFWAKRFVARGFEGSGKTGVLCSLVLGSAVALVYGLAAPFMMALMGVGGSYMLPYMLISVQVFEIYAIRGLRSVLHPMRPEAVGYAIMVKEGVKLAVAFFLVFQYRLGLLGAICSVLVAQAAQIAFSSLMARPFLKGSFRASYVREWLKGSFLPIYSFIGQRVPPFSLIVLFSLAGEVARGYYGAAQTIGMMIFNTSFLAYALYPRLLAQEGPSGSGGGSEDVEKALRLVLMFAIPMTVGAMLLSDLLTAILKASYGAAWLVLTALAPYYALRSLSFVFESVVSGSERVDAKARIPARKLVRTKLFALYTIPYVYGAIMIALAFLLVPTARDALDASLRVALLFTASSAASTLATYFLARRSMDFPFPLDALAKCLIASAVMAIPLVVLPHAPFRLYWATTLVVIGALTYSAVLLAIDREARDLIKALLRAMLPKLRR